VRPTYETARDVDNERAVAEVIERRLRLTARKLPRHYELDYVLTDGDEVRGFAEIKCRTNALEQYPTYIISGHKWEYGLRWEALAHAPFVIVVRFTDGIYYCRPRYVQGHRVMLGGRRDRGDEQDIEPVVHIPVGEFTLLEKAEA
jgi:hypothetical protein